jgi:hypothetical protein
MTLAAIARTAVTLLIAAVCASCGSAEPQRVLTVEEVVPQIDRLNGQTVSVAGYLAECGGYDCTLYRDKADSEQWDQFMAAVQANRKLPIPNVPTLGIGSGTNFEFDAKAAPFTNSYVVVTGTITNECRFEGKLSCTDRGPDIKPATIRAGHPPARG